MTNISTTKRTGLNDLSVSHWNHVLKQCNKQITKATIYDIHYTACLTQALKLLWEYLYKFSQSSLCDSYSHQSEVPRSSRASHAHQSEWPKATICPPTTNLWNSRKTFHSQCGKIFSCCSWAISELPTSVTDCLWKGSIILYCNFYFLVILLYLIIYSHSFLDYCLIVLC